jgi:hypothetical protein
MVFFMPVRSGNRDSNWSDGAPAGAAAPGPDRARFSVGPPCCRLQLAVGGRGEWQRRAAAVPVRSHVKYYGPGPGCRRRIMPDIASVQVRVKPELQVTQKIIMIFSS